MATGAAGDGIFRGMLEGCISGHDMEIQRRPYHRNCGCALHKSRGRCPHSPKHTTVSYPVRRSWSEGCLSLMSAAAGASGHSSPGSSSPSVPTTAAEVGKTATFLVSCNEEDEEQQQIVSFKV